MKPSKEGFKKWIKRLKQTNEEWYIDVWLNERKTPELINNKDEIIIEDDKLIINKKYGVTRALFYDDIRRFIIFLDCKEPKGIDVLLKDVTNYTITIYEDEN